MGHEVGGTGGGWDRRWVGHEVAGTRGGWDTRWVGGRMWQPMVGGGGCWVMVVGLRLLAVLSRGWEEWLTVGSGAADNRGSRPLALGTGG